MKRKKTNHNGSVDSADTGGRGSCHRYRVQQFGGGGELVVGGGRDWKWDKETDGTSSEVDWFGQFTHTHHTSHTSRVMEERRRR